MSRLSKRMASDFTANKKMSLGSQSFTQVVQT